MSINSCLNTFDNNSTGFIISTSLLGVTLFALGILETFILPPGISPEVWRIATISTFCSSVVSLNISFLIASIRRSQPQQKEPTKEVPHDVLQLSRIELLPQEILLRILSESDLKTIGNCSFVSRMFASIAEDESLWRLKSAQIPGIKYLPSNITCWKTFCLTMHFLKGPNRNIVHNEPKWGKILQKKRSMYLERERFGDLLYCWGSNYGVFVFDLKSKKLKESFVIPGKDQFTVRTFLDVDRVVISNQIGISLWNKRTKKTECQFKDINPHAECYKIGNFLLFSEITKNLNSLFDASGNCLCKIPGIYRANNGVVALFVEETYLTLWNIESQTKIREVKIDEAWGKPRLVSTMSKDYFAVSFTNQKVFVWDLIDEAIMYPFDYPSCAVIKVSIMDDYLQIHSPDDESREIFHISSGESIYKSSISVYTQSIWLQPNLLLYAKFGDSPELYLQNVFTGEVLKSWPENEETEGMFSIFGLEFINDTLVSIGINPDLAFGDFS